MPAPAWQLKRAGPACSYPARAEPYGDRKLLISKASVLIQLRRGQRMASEAMVGGTEILLRRIADENTACFEMV